MLNGRVLIEKTLGEEPRRLVPQGTELQGTVLDPEMRPNGGRIRLVAPVCSFIGREKCFGKHEPAKYDHTRVPKKFWTKRILVPYIECFEIVSGRPVLHMILFRADNVVRVNNRVKIGEATIQDLQASVNRYYDEVENALCGKNGLLNRHIFGVRCKNSARFVMVPEPDLKYYEIGVPRTVANEAKIDNGDFVLAMRSPVLWQGSVLVMRAVLVDGMAGQANPFIMKGLGLDFDGDQMSVVKVPLVFNPHLRQELDKAIDDPTLEIFEWGDEFLINNREKTATWRQISLDLASRLAVSGLSISPQEALDTSSSEFLQTCDMAAKKVPADFENYAEGLGIGVWAREAERAAMETTQLKMEIGQIGAATDKLCQVLLAFDESLLRRGLELKEALTDKMMKNAKQSLGTGFNTGTIVNLIDRRDEFNGASPDMALAYLKQIGFDPDYYRPVIELLYDMGGATNAVKQFMPLLQVCRKRDRETLVEVLEAKWGFASIAARIHEYGQEGADEDSDGLLPYKRILSAGSTNRTSR